ncbi:hypothetical protein [Jannaschia ovalis]|uniref:Uncharacterized protein n=1 Tax=Jannaschia ovalis TaxID=3038773 RepID=A0ABY8LAK1_9RHOB|nr:hypothetical protein [Jannaschia sp. GRR-S6-38]WGH78356.1 hypothetical protein P8627_15230 [Jannaschia sp. GRR-S6-38]
MATIKLERDRIADADLPVAQLARQMRLPEGYATVPGQEARLQARLRAAIADIEARLAKSLLLRGAVMERIVGGGRDCPLMLAPVREVLSVKRLDAGAPEMLEVATLRAEAHCSIVSLVRPVPEGARLRFVLRAGYGGWDDLPEGAAQAVLLLAEGLDSGDAEAASRRAAALIAPERDLRLGARG